MGLLRRIEGSGPVGPAPGARPPAATPAGGEPGGSLSSTGDHSAAAAPPPPRVSVSERRPSADSRARDLKTRVKSKLIADLDPNTDLSKTMEVRQKIKSLFDQ